MVVLHKVQHSGGGAVVNLDHPNKLSVAVTVTVSNRHPEKVSGFRDGLILHTCHGHSKIYLKMSKDHRHACHLFTDT
jgi:hypothetical protein